MQGFVYIIESPSAKELLDGCAEGRALGNILKLSNISHYYNLVTNQETLITALSKRLSSVLQEHNYLLPPILHMSMHGDEDGVGLTDNTHLSWADLRYLLAPLNNALNGGLLICMSSCFGSSGYRIAMDEGNDQPFWALVGNDDEVAWGDSAVAYITFYHLFFKEIPVEECVERMKLASGDTRFRVWLGHQVKASWIKHIQEVRRDEAIRRIRQKIDQRRLIR